MYRCWNQRHGYRRQLDQFRLDCGFHLSEVVLKLEDIWVSRRTDISATSGLSRPVPHHLTQWSDIKAVRSSSRQYLKSPALLLLHPKLSAPVPLSRCAPRMLHHLAAAWPKAGWQCRSQWHTIPSAPYPGQPANGIPWPPNASAVLLPDAADWSLAFQEAPHWMTVLPRPCSLQGWWPLCNPLLPGLVLLDRFGSALSWALGCLWLRSSAFACLRWKFSWCCPSAEACLDCLPLEVWGWQHSQFPSFAWLLCLGASFDLVHRPLALSGSHATSVSACSSLLSGVVPLPLGCGWGFHARTWVPYWGGQPERPEQQSFWFCWLFSGHLDFVRNPSHERRHCHVPVQLASGQNPLQVLHPWMPCGSALFSFWHRAMVRCWCSDFIPSPQAPALLASCCLQLWPSVVFGFLCQGGLDFRGYCVWYSHWPYPREWAGGYGWTFVIGSQPSSATVWSSVHRWWLQPWPWPSEYHHHTWALGVPWHPRHPCWAYWPTSCCHLPWENGAGLSLSLTRNGPAVCFLPSGRWVSFRPFLPHWQLRGLFGFAWSVCLACPWPNGLGSCLRSATCHWQLVLAWLSLGPRLWNLLAKGWSSQQRCPPAEMQAPCPSHARPWDPTQAAIVPRHVGPHQD